MRPELSIAAFALNGVLFTSMGAAIPRFGAAGDGCETKIPLLQCIMATKMTI